MRQKPIFYVSIIFENRSDIQCLHFVLEYFSHVKYTNYICEIISDNPRKEIKMKKLFMKLILFAVVLTFALSISSCEKKGDFSAPAGMITASDEKADFYLYVPDDWTVDLSTKAAGAYYSESDPSSVSVISWELENTDTSLDEWWEINIGDVELVFDNVNIEAEENITVDEIYGKKYIYTASLGEFEYKIMQVACIKNSVVYVFTYTSVAENFDLHTDDVNLMLEYLIIK